MKTFLRRLFDFTVTLFIASIATAAIVVEEETEIRIPILLAAVKTGEPTWFDLPDPAAKRAICLELKPCRKLAEVGYFEARGERNAGVVAVMNTVLNRVEHSRFPSTVHGVVHAKAQFSYLWDSRIVLRYSEKEQYERMLELAHDVYLQYIEPVTDATHYHTTAIRTSWGPKLDYLAHMDNHIFYRE